jgi:hypothetical protein
MAGGCGGSEDAPTPPDVTRRIINVAAVDRDYTARGVTEQILGSALGQVYVRDAAGEFQDVSYGRLDGSTFRVEVDDGLVYLEIRGHNQFGSEFIVGPRDDVDAGSVTPGRGSTEPSAPLRLGGGGLLPWQGTDTIVLHGPNIRATRFLVTLTVAPGATMFGPFVSDPFSTRISAAQGDEIWILQERGDNVDGVRYRHYERTLYKANIEQPPGNTTDATGTFVAPAAEQLDIDVRLSQFAATAGVDPSILGASAKLVYQPYSLPRSFGAVHYVHPLVDLDLSMISQDKVISLPYGNPFPSSWDTHLELSTSTGKVNYAFPGTAPVLLGGGLYLEMPIGEAEAAPLVPRIGFVRDLVIDGKPTDQATNVSETATIAWQAPALGSASGYAVDLYELELRQDTNPAYTSLVEVARFFTTTTSLQLPPGLLRTGRTYFFKVNAFSGGIDVLSSPHRVTGAYGSSTVLSSKFSR